MEQTPDSFDRARRLSRWLSGVFAVTVYVVPVLVALMGIAFVSFYDEVFAALGDNGLPATAPPYLSIPRRLLLVAAFALYCTPGLVTLVYLRGLFASFARGAVFTAGNVLRLRRIGVWLLVSVVTANLAQVLFFAISRHPEPDVDITLLPALYAAMIYVVAYVLEEANRIADDNSRFV